MIDCSEYRRRLLAEPRATTPEITAHRAACEACEAYTRRLIGFEDRLEAALRFDLPSARPSAPGLPAGVERAPATRRRSRVRRPVFALAASVLAASVIGLALWLGDARASLASAVVAHVVEEPQSWTAAQTVPAPSLAQVLADSHLRLLVGAGDVTYARSCLFRGHRVPHLVVQNEGGTATVMVLVHESVAKPERFAERGYSGVIVPITGHGSLAIITRPGEKADLDRILATVVAAIRWT